MKLCSNFIPTYMRPSYKILCDPITFHQLPDNIRETFLDWPGCLGCSDEHLIILRAKLSIHMDLNLQLFYVSEYTITANFCKSLFIFANCLTKRRVMYCLYCCSEVYIIIIMQNKVNKTSYLKRFI